MQRWCRCRKRSAVAVTSNIDSVQCTSRSRRPTTVSMVICRILRRSIWVITAHCITWPERVTFQRRRTVIILLFQLCRWHIRLLYRLQPAFPLVWQCVLLCKSWAEFTKCLSIMIRHSYDMISQVENLRQTCNQYGKLCITVGPVIRTVDILALVG